MQYISKALGLLLIILLTGCATTLESKWQTSEQPHVGITSSVNDYHYASDAGIMYTVSNSSDSLFLKMKFPDELTATKVLRFGLTVWLDPRAKRNKAYGLGFPLGQKRSLNTPGGRLPEPEVVEGDDGFKRLRYPESKGKEKRSHLIRENTEIMLVGFGGREKPQILSTSEAPFPVKLFYDKNKMLSYQLAMPLQALHINDFTDGDAISLGIIAGSNKGPDRSDKMRGRDPVAGGRRGGMIPGGSTRRNRHMGNQSPYPDIIQPEIVWIKKVYLALERSSQD